MSPLNAIHPALSDSLRSVFQFPRVERLHIWSYILKFPATSIIPVLSLCLPGYCVHPVRVIYCSFTEESCAASRSVLKCLFLCDCFLLKFMAALHHSFFFIFLFSFSIFSLHRCEGTGLMRFFPSMLLAQKHRVTMPTTGWILILALLVAQQVRLFLPEQGCRGSLFQSHPLFQTSRFDSQVNHLMLGKKNKNN